MSNTYNIFLTKKLLNFMGLNCAEQIHGIYFHRFCYFPCSAKNSSRQSLAKLNPPKFSKAKTGEREI